jgi:hypothetical protein
VKVWNDPSHNLGTTVYPTYGFIYQDAATAVSARITAASDTAVAMAQSAASQVAAAVRPGSAPMQMLNQAADSTDHIAALIQAAAGQAPADKK